MFHMVPVLCVTLHPDFAICTCSCPIVSLSQDIDPSGSFFKGISCHTHLHAHVRTNCLQRENHLEGKVCWQPTWGHVHAFPLSLLVLNSDTEHTMQHFSCLSAEAAASAAELTSGIWQWICSPLWDVRRGSHQTKNHTLTSYHQQIHPPAALKKAT